MENKYIIELEEVPFAQEIEQGPARGVAILWRVKGFNSLVFDANGLDKLKSAEEALDSAYAHGRTSAEAEYYSAIEREKSAMYNSGASDMLEALRYILGASNSHDWEDMGFTCEKYDYSSNLRSIIFDCGPEEIIEKTKAHLEKVSATGLRQNIKTIITDCGYSLEEIYETVKEMRDES